MRKHPWSCTGRRLKFGRIIVAAVLAFQAAQFIPYRFGFEQGALVGRILDLFVPLTVAIILYFILCLVFNIREVKTLAGFLRGGWRTKNK